MQQGKEVAIDESLTPELKREGLMREVIRHIQAARKNAGLNVDDRISFSLSTDNSELDAAITEHLETITAETLGTNMINGDLRHTTEVRVEGASLTISLAKVA